MMLCEWHENMPHKKRPPCAVVFVAIRKVREACFLLLEHKKLVRQDAFGCVSGSLVL